MRRGRFAPSKVFQVGALNALGVSLRHHGGGPARRAYASASALRAGPPPFNTLVVKESVTSKKIKIRGSGGYLGRRSTRRRSLTRTREMKWPRCVRP